MKKASFSFFDFDNTLYKGKNRYLILDFPEFLVVKSYFDRKELKKLQDLRTLYSNQGISRDEFTIRVIESYYKGLAGQSDDEISKQANIFWEMKPDDLWFSYTIPLLDLMKKHTIIILVSGSPLEILRLIYKKIGIEILYGTQGIIERGVYTGAFNPYQEMATYKAKSKFIIDISVSHQFNPDTSFAFGDSESDFPLLNAVDAHNSYLIGTDKNSLDRSINKHWNIVQRNDSLLISVKNRVAKVFQESET
jgi:HAD superfamily phosphoserine phosphatase-like hydrolase